MQWHYIGQSNENGMMRNPANLQVWKDFDSLHNQLEKNQVISPSPWWIKVNMDGCVLGNLGPSCGHIFCNS